MKKRNNYFTVSKTEKMPELGSSDYIEMFEEGYTDIEISKELGINEEYIKTLREEYLSDY